MVLESQHTINEEGRFFTSSVGEIGPSPTLRAPLGLAHVTVTSVSLGSGASFPEG